MTAWIEQDAAFTQLQSLSDLESINGTSTQVIMREGFCPEWSGSLCSVLVMQALGGLTGVKASIPIAIVSWGTLFWPDSFPLELSEGSQWLSTWYACLFFSILVLLEVISDLFPAVDTVADGILLFLKPLFAYFLASAPYYGSNSAAHWIHVAGPMLSLVMAITKAIHTVMIDVMSGGCGSPLRSMAETTSVTVLTFLTMVTVFVSIVVILMCLTMLFIVCLWRKRRKRRRTLRKRNTESTWRRWLVGDVYENDGDDDSSCDSSSYCSDSDSE